MEYGVDQTEHYVKKDDTWVTRFKGWYVPWSRTKFCGHEHETEERARKCAQTLLNRTRRDSY